MVVRGGAFFHEWEGALPFFGMSSSSARRLELLEQHRRVVADARVRERGELVRIGAAEEAVLGHLGRSSRCFVGLNHLTWFGARLCNAQMCNRM